MPVVVVATMTAKPESVEEQRGRVERQPAQRRLAVRADAEVHRANEVKAGVAAQQVLRVGQAPDAGRVRLVPGFDFDQHQLVLSSDAARIDYPFDLQERISGQASAADRNDRRWNGARLDRGGRSWMRRGKRLSISSF